MGFCPSCPLFCPVYFASREAVRSHQGLKRAFVWLWTPGQSYLSGSDSLPPSLLLSLPLFSICPSFSIWIVLSFSPPLTLFYALRVCVQLQQWDSRQVTDRRWKVLYINNFSQGHFSDHITDQVLLIFILDQVQKILKLSQDQWTCRVLHISLWWNEWNTNYSVTKTFMTFGSVMNLL